MSAADSMVRVDPPTTPARSQPAPSGGVVWWRTLRLLSSEIRLIAGRRRNQMGLLVLAVVPILMAVAGKLSRNASSRSDRIFTRTGGQSFSGNSSSSRAGIQ